MKKAAVLPIVYCWPREATSREKINQRMMMPIAATD